MKLKNVGFLVSFLNKLSIGSFLIIKSHKFVELSPCWAMSEFLENVLGVSNSVLIFLLVIQPPNLKPTLLFRIEGLPLQWNIDSIFISLCHTYSTALLFHSQMLSGSLAWILSRNVANFRQKKVWTNAVIYARSAVPFSILLCIEYSPLIIFCDKIHARHR